MTAGRNVVHPTNGQVNRATPVPPASVTKDLPLQKGWNHSDMSLIRRKRRQVLTMDGYSPDHTCWMGIEFE